MSAKLRPSVFLSAAQLIQSGKVTGCCDAMENNPHERRFFCGLFQADGKASTGFVLYWFGHDFQSRIHRIYALLLAAEIAKEGGL